MPDVSVVITTYDRPHSLIRSIESVRAATSGEVEIVVVDDASTEETAQACREQPHITYVRAERNQGVAGARNIGIMASRGEYLSFLDDDDLRLPGSLDHQVRALEQHPSAGFVYGQAIVQPVNGGAAAFVYPATCPQGDVFWELLGQNFVPCGAAVFRRSCCLKVGLLEDSIPGIDDWDLWVRISERYRVLASEQPVMVWRASTPSSGQGTSRAATIAMLSTTRFRQHWLPLPRAASCTAAQKRDMRRRFSNTTVRHLLWQAWRGIAQKQMATATSNIGTALRLHPAAVARVLLQPRTLQSFARRGPEEWWAMRSTGSGYDSPLGAGM